MCSKCRICQGRHRSWSAHPSHTCESDGIFPPAAKGKSQWEPGRSQAVADPGGSETLVIVSLVPQGILGMSEDGSGSNSWKQYWHLVGRSQDGGWISYRAGQNYHRTLSGLKGQCQGRETKSSSLHVAVIPPVLQPAGERERGCPSLWEEAWSSLRTSQHSGGCKAQTAEFVGTATHDMHHPAQLLLVMM